MSAQISGHLFAQPAVGYSKYQTSCFAFFFFLGFLNFLLILSATR